jgi:hypothetical protein
MADSSTLPEGWETVIDAIDGQLQTAIWAAEARVVALPSSTAEPASSARRGDLAAIAVRAMALSQRVTRSQTLADEADTVLAAGEEFLRWRLAEAEALRARLAAWAARTRDSRA